jgi:hypothetical protein
MAQADRLAPFLLAAALLRGRAVVEEIPRPAEVRRDFGMTQGLGSERIWGNCREMVDDEAVGIERKENPTSRKRREKWGTRLCLAGGTTASISEKWRRCSSCWMRRGGGLGWVGRLGTTSGMT